MKRMIACVSLVAAATTAAVPAPVASGAAGHAPVAKATAKAVTKCRVAPADEYFGKLKMSILGIRNVIKDQGLKVDYAPENAPSTFSTMALAEDALHDWEHKYPCDSWLPGTIFALEHFYLKIHTDSGVKHVHATFAWLRHDYPKARIVALARRDDAEATSATPAPLVDATPSGALAGAAPPAASLQPGASAPPAPPAKLVPVPTASTSSAVVPH